MAGALLNRTPREYHSAGLRDCRSPPGIHPPTYTIHPDNYEVNRNQPTSTSPDTRRKTSRQTTVTWYGQFGSPTAPFYSRLQHETGLT